MKKEDIALCARIGSAVRDRVSTVAGELRAVTVYGQGDATRCLVQPYGLTLDGGIREAQWIDIDRLEFEDEPPKG